MPHPVVCDLVPSSPRPRRTGALAPCTRGTLIMKDRRSRWSGFVLTPPVVLEHPTSNAARATIPAAGRFYTTVPPFREHATAAWCDSMSTAKEKGSQMVCPQAESALVRLGQPGRPAERDGSEHGSVPGSAAPVRAPADRLVRPAWPPLRPAVSQRCVAEDRRSAVFCQEARSARPRRGAVDACGRLAELDGLRRYQD